jgi:hypothetical protein
MKLVRIHLGKSSEPSADDLTEDRRWHIGCFRCSTCGTLLDGDSSLLLQSNGGLICSNCTYSCSACGNKIEDLAILTGDQALCGDCFRCRNCERKIENLKYARTSQGIFCMLCHDSVAAHRQKTGKHLAQLPSDINVAAEAAEAEARARQAEAGARQAEAALLLERRLAERERVFHERQRQAEIEDRVRVEVDAQNHRRRSVHIQQLVDQGAEVLRQAQEAERRRRESGTLFRIDRDRYRRQRSITLFDDDDDRWRYRDNFVPLPPRALPHSSSGSAGTLDLSEQATNLVSRESSSPQRLSDPARPPLAATRDRPAKESKSSLFRGLFGSKKK